MRDDCLYVHIVGYDKYKDAENESDPAVEYIVRVPIGELFYDSRYFKNVFFVEEPSARENVLSRISRRVNLADLTEKSVKWLKKAIKQIKQVICVFQYPYFWDDDKEFEKFRNDILYKLVDQWKKMEAELAARRGRL